MTRGLTRIVCMWVIFGLGASALHGLGEGAAVILSAIVALAINYAWRDQQRKQLAREHREAIEADTEVRIATAQRVLATQAPKQTPPAETPPSQASVSDRR